jgi:hypothetical protein
MKLDYKFDSVGELVAALNTPFVCAENARHGQDNDGPWYCSDRKPATYEARVAALNEPTFPAGVLRVEKMMANLQAPTPTSRRRRPARAEAGDELDMGRVWDGDLENAWRTMRRERSVGPSRVLIVVDCGAHAGIDSDAMAQQGAAALALARTLLDSGYVVQIVAATTCLPMTRTAMTYTMEVMVLGAGEEVDIHKLASLTASALLFRAAVLGHQARVLPEVADYGLSRRAGTPAVDTAGFDYVAQCGDECRTVYGGKDWLAKHLTALGGAAE